MIIAEAIPSDVGLNVMMMAPMLTQLILAMILVFLSSNQPAFSNDLKINHARTVRLFLRCRDVKCMQCHVEQCHVE